MKMEPWESIQDYLEPGEHKVLLDINWSLVHYLPEEMEGPKMKLINLLVKRMSKLLHQVPNYYISSSLEKSLESILQKFSIDPSHNHTIAYITFTPFTTVLDLPKIKEQIIEIKNILSDGNPTEIRMKIGDVINSGEDFTIRNKDLIQAARNAMIKEIRSSYQIDVYDFFNRMADDVSNHDKKFLDRRFGASLIKMHSKAKFNPYKQFTVLLHNYLYFNSDFSVYTSEDQISPDFFELAFHLLKAHGLFEDDFYSFKDRFRKYL